jgi:tRNA U34 5-methylaminomethyl-2-thiouridine-forming methyltransferase MnmC
LDSGYKIIPTEDESVSLYLKEYDQAMHSLSGAYQESLLKHVRPSMICRMPSGDRLVLDVGFGIGYNVLALLVEYFSGQATGHLTVISLEKDENLLPFMDMISFNDTRDEYYGAIQMSYRNGEYSSGRFTLRMLKGDARKSLLSLDPLSFDAVFHDPFSPAKNPELWTVDFFNKIYAVMKPGALLTTYSSAKHIRRAFLDAGFFISSGPSVGRKREGTIASKGPVNGAFQDDRIAELINDHQSVPYRDPSLLLEREEILRNRIEEMKIKKGLQAP